MFVLRLLLGFTVLAYLTMASYAWGHMFAGNGEPLADLIGFDKSVELNWLAAGVLLLSNVTLLSSLAMIAYAAAEQAQHRPADDLTLSARPRWPLDQTTPSMLGSGKKGAKA